VAREFVRLPAQNTIYEAALRIADFADEHPGTYAMGDRAGLVGFLLEDPVIQLEGLVMDRKFLQNISARRDLVDVLEEYEVDYYIATNPTPVAGRYEECEPSQAGPNSPVMRGSFGLPPVYEFSVGGVRTAIFAPPW